MISVSNILRQQKEPITELLEEFAYSPDLITKIEQQYQNICLVKWIETKDNQKFWAEVHNYKDGGGVNPFEDLLEFVRKCLVMTISNADIERVFSAMNIIKPKAKSRMKTKLLQCLLTIRFSLKASGENCYSYDIPKDVISKIGTMMAYKGTDSDLSDLIF